MQPLSHTDVLPKIQNLKIQNKANVMAPRPSVRKHPFTLMLVVLALTAPFAGLAWRTREWMGW